MSPQGAQVPERQHLDVGAFDVGHWGPKVAPLSLAQWLED